jgi:hypothetical protein
VPNRSTILTKYYLYSENGRIVGPPLTAATNILLAVPLDVYPRPLVICIIRLGPNYHYSLDYSGHHQFPRIHLILTRRRRIFILS